MIKYGITFYDDLWNYIFKLKDKSKIMKNYLNASYGSCNYNKSTLDMYIDAKKLENTNANIKVENNYLYITLFYKTYKINIGYIFIDDKITIDRYSDMLTCFLQIPKSLIEIPYTSTKKEKPITPPNPCLWIHAVNDYDELLYDNKTLKFNPVTQHQKYFQKCVLFLVEGDSAASFPSMYDRRRIFRTNRYEDDTPLYKYAGKKV